MEPPTRADPETAKSMMVVVLASRSNPKLDNRLCGSSLAGFKITMILGPLCKKTPGSCSTSNPFEKHDDPYHDERHSSSTKIRFLYHLRLREAHSRSEPTRTARSPYPRR